MAIQGVLIPITEFSFDGSLEINLHTEFLAGVNKARIPLQVAQCPKPSEIEPIRKMAESRGYDIQLIVELPNLARHNTALYRKSYYLEFTKQSKLKRAIRD